MQDPFFRYGFMPSFYSDIEPQLRYAKKHFDFVELTFNPKIDYSHEYVGGLVNLIEDFPVLGHLHWDLDLSEASEAQITAAKNQIDILEELGARFLTIHPSGHSNLPEASILSNNARSFEKLGAYCRKKGLGISIENTQDRTFSDAKNIRTMLSAAGSGSSITLDIGHAELSSRGGYLAMLKAVCERVAHVHLHHTYRKFDHIPFDTKENVHAVLQELKRTNSGRGIPLTVTLEMFYQMSPDKENWIPMDEVWRKKILVEQLEMLKTD